MRKRGRPAGALVDRQWADEQKARLSALIAAAQRDNKNGLAEYARARLGQFEAALPKRFYAGRPAQIYLELGDAPGPIAALDGPMRDRTRMVFRSAVESVRVFLFVRRMVEGNTAQRLQAKLLGEARALTEEARELRHHMPILRESADRACGGAWAHWQGRPATIKTGLFAVALEILDEGGADWPRELRPTDKGRAILVVSKASGASIHATKGIWRQK